MTNFESITVSPEALAEWLGNCGQKELIPKIMYEEDWEWWLKEKHDGK